MQTALRLFCSTIGLLNMLTAGWGLNLLDPTPIPVATATAGEWALVVMFLSGMLLAFIPLVTWPGRPAQV